MEREERLILEGYTHFRNCKPVQQVDNDDPYKELLNYSYNDMLFNIKESIYLWDCAQKGIEEFRIGLEKMVRRNSL
jgi:hypothetical protein